MAVNGLLCADEELLTRSLW